MNAATLGRTLRWARKRAGMTQQDLADALGIPQPTVARIERGAVLPRAATLIAMLEATGHQLVVEPKGPAADAEEIKTRLPLTPPMRVRRSLGRATANARTGPIHLLRRLRRFAVPFVLVGDLAEVVHGSPAPLGDTVEVCHAATDVAAQRIALTLEDLGQAARSLTLLTETAAGDDYETLFRNSQQMHPDAGLLVRVAALEDLIRIRQARGTATDRVQAGVLRAVIDESARRDRG